MTEAPDRSATGGGVDFATADVRVLLWHAALYGAAAIAEDAGVADLRICWTGGMEPRPCIVGRGLDPDRLGELVHRHATERAAPGSWVTRTVTIEGAGRGLMSPRLSMPKDLDRREAHFERLYAKRHDVLDELTDARRLLDLRLVGAVGQPAYWRRNLKGEQQPDDGASRWEMQPRNQGSEIVGNRFAPLAAALQSRTTAEVTAGLIGDAVRDEVGGDRVDSRTPTGMASPGPTDSAVAWCALWGLSQFPVALRVATLAATSAHIGRRGAEWFVVPVWHRPWALARLRTVVASGALRAAGTTGLGDKVAVPDADASRARQWLRARDAVGLVRFPVNVFGSASAPERRAMRGELIRTE